MLSAEQNELVTRTGPDTPAGELMRRYWQPAALTEELEGDRPVRALRLLGEDLVLFRDDQGRYGLLGRHCPHRGADLCYGRLENGGLRCAFHGWLFDVDGRCLEQPAEPPESNFHTKIRHRAYACVERNGIVFAFLGPGEPPAFPDFDCFVAPEEYTFAFKGYLDANWLQALEVGIDPAHASFLHRFLEDEDPAEGYGQQFRGQSSNSSIPVTRLLRDNPCPRIDVEETDYGIRIFALRSLDEETTHIRITNLAFPNFIVIPLSADMVLTQWHVPIDDSRSWWYAIFSSFHDRVDKQAMRRQRLELYTLPDYVPRRNRSNDWGYDPEEQRTLTYTGMGLDINVHDNWAVESPGPILDRTAEHLGATDRVITTYRRILIGAINGLRKGEVPPMMINDNEANRFRGPVAIDTIGPADGWKNWWKEIDLRRRDSSEWATSPW